jgi:hypothetical protein
MKLAALASVLIVAAMSAPAFAQRAASQEPTQLDLGREILAKDPRSAIAHFERIDSREGREWLAVALMMESRAPSDRYVERAFASAFHSRVAPGAPAPAREALSAALHPGELVIAFLIGESDAYAWAFDRDAFVGYQLPPPATVGTAVERLRGYAEAKDRDGVARIADDLLPALFGPAFERLPKLKRVILAVDGPLQQLPLDALAPSLPRRLVVAKASYASLLETINTPSPQPPASPTLSSPVVVAAIALALAAGAAFVSLRARRRSRAPS